MFTSTNPTDINEVIATVPESSATEILTVLRTAKNAQKGWAKLPAPTRGRIIANVGRLVESNKEALAKLITKEMGKVYSEALGEVQEVVDTCDFFLGEGRRLYGQTVPSEMQNKNLFTFRMPVGNVFVITAGNFPTAVPSWYIVPALLAGNTVVWKPSEFTPAVANALTEIFHAGGVPKDVLITVVADGAQTFAALDAGLKEGVINKVGFTGSTEVGRKIGAKTGEYIQSACLELGGKNPMVVMPDANIDLALDGALFAGFGTAGQRCTSLGTLWIHESIYDTVLAKFASLVENAAVGDPFKDTSGPSMNILIKLMSIVSLVIAPSLAQLHPTTPVETKSQTVEISVINTDSASAMADSATTVTISADTKTLVQALQEDGLAPKDNVNIQVKDGKISVNGVALTEAQNEKYAAYLKKK